MGQTVLATTDEHKRCGSHRLAARPLVHPDHRRTLSAALPLERRTRLPCIECSKAVPCPLDRRTASRRSETGGKCLAPLAGERTPATRAGTSAIMTQNLLGLR